MKLQFLGSGNAFVSLHENFNSNMVLESPSGKRLLIDCGSDARHSSEAVGLRSKDFDAVYISHCHADHAGGLEWLAFTTKFDPSADKPKLITHPSLVSRLWNQVLSGGLESIKDVDCNLTTYFSMYPLVDDTHFVWENIQFEMIKTTHVYNNKTLLPSYGLLFNNKKHKVMISTDTTFTPDLFMPYYKAADVIFHDCDTGVHDSCVHPSFSDLNALPTSIKNKMWLYHYSNVNLPDAVKAGFLGFVKRGQRFEF